MNQQYRVNEIFTSVQGEGVLVGIPSTFIRLQVCTVGCPWCDTKYTWAKGGQLMEVKDILDQVTEHHVVITGGEPTIWNLDPLLGALRKSGHITQLETSGQQALKGDQKPDWVTWSPKQNLGFEAPMEIKNIADEVKFVVDEHLPVSAVQKIIDYMHYERKSPRVTIVMMPEGCPPDEISIGRAMSFLSVEDIDYHGLSKRFGWRLQYTLQVR